MFPILVVRDMWLNVLPTLVVCVLCFVYDCCSHDWLLVVHGLVCLPNLVVHILIHFTGLW